MNIGLEAARVGESLSDSNPSVETQKVLGDLAMTSRVEQGTVDESEKWSHGPNGLSQGDFARGLSTKEAIEGGCTGPTLAVRSFKSALRGAAKQNPGLISNQYDPVTKTTHYFLSREGAKWALDNSERIANLGLRSKRLLGIVLTHTYPAEES